MSDERFRPNRGNKTSPRPQKTTENAYQTFAPTCTATDAWPTATPNAGPNAPRFNSRRAPSSK
eukprot:722524-Lingulodinium_polyedra.AAC.1